MPLPGPDFDPDAPADGSGGLYGLPHTPQEAAVVVMPVPFEVTTSFGRGTARAPARVFEASHQVELNDAWVSEPWRAGIAMLPTDPRIEALNEEGSALAMPIVAAGGPGPDTVADLDRVNAIGSALNQIVHDTTAGLLQRGAIPGILGGDHSVSFGAIRAAANRFPGVGLLHIDAHADLRIAYEGFTWSHASVLYNVHELGPDIAHIVQVGIRDFGRDEAKLIETSDRITAFTDQELAWELASGSTWTSAAARIVRALPERVWVTFDIDGLNPSLCPRTGTPVPGGLSFNQALILLQYLASERQIVGFDLVEVGDGEWDANVGARLLYKLAGWAIQTHQ